MTGRLPRWSRRPAADVLERRYRRLLAWYPAGYRAANAEEMLGVALAAAKPGQRRPGPAESASLIVSGISTRLGGVRAGLREPSWRDAAAVVAIIGPILIAAFSAEPAVVPGYVRAGSFWSGLSRISVLDVILMVGWTLVAAAAIARWHRMAAAGACAGVIGLASMQGDYSGDAFALVTGWWKLVLGVVVVLSAVVAIGNDRRPLSRRAITAAALSAGLLVLWPLLESSTATAQPAFIVIMLLLAIKPLSPAIRRRAGVLLLPVFVTIAPVSWILIAVIDFNLFPGTSPTATEWGALAVVPVLSFAVGLIWIARYERKLRITA